MCDDVTVGYKNHNTITSSSLCKQKSASHQFFHFISLLTHEKSLDTLLNISYVKTRENEAKLCVDSIYRLFCVLRIAVALLIRLFRPSQIRYLLFNHTKDIFLIFALHRRSQQQRAHNTQFF